MNYRCQELPLLLTLHAFAARPKKLLRNTPPSTYLSSTKSVFAHSILYSNMHLKYCRYQTITGRSYLQWSYSETRTSSSWSCCQTLQTIDSALHYIRTKQQQQSKKDLDSPGDRNGDEQLTSGRQTVF
jgi:hypothetical protein